MSDAILRWCRVVVWVGVLGVAGGLGAQEPVAWRNASEVPFDFDAGRVWRGALPPPSAVLGYEIGEAYADHGAWLRVLEAYRRSERLLVKETGRTPERRPMHVLVISAPGNLARIETILATNRRLADGRRPMVEEELTRAVATQPIIVWLSYNVHGDEAAGTEAAMQVLHTLLDDDSAETQAWLREVVVVMNPCQNPDGRERFVVWANAHGVGRPEPFAYEKENPWNVQGRYNHHYFDLNRDLVALTQPESRHTAAAYLEWLPQVAVDHHGETKHYFFPPAALPVNPNLPREQIDRWHDVFGRGNAAAFDAQRWMYYVRDVFDLFYPGYWDSWPSLQGATGMTYETSGGGKEGFNRRRDDGTIMTLRQSIAQHTVASLATIRTAATHRLERLRDFHAFFVSAVAAGRSGRMQQVFLPQSVGPDDPLVALLLRQGIEVQFLREAVTVPQARAFVGGDPAPVEIPAGAAVVDLAQPRGRLARALLEPHTEMDGAFIERQFAKVARNRERGENEPEDEDEFYDQTAWSLPLFWGVPAFMTDVPLDLTARTLGADAVRARTTAAATVGAPGAGAAAAWVIPIDRVGAREGALRLLRAGYRVAAAVRPLQAGEHVFPRGSLIVRAERNPPEVAAVLPAAAVALETTFPATGPTGIGSESTLALRVPKVLLAAGRPVTPSSYGATWHLFESLDAVDVVPVAAERLGELDLRGFNVLVLPSGSASDWAKVLDAAGRARLRDWVAQGGTLICLGGAAEFAVDAETAWVEGQLIGRAETKSAPADEPEDEAGAAEDTALPFDDRLRPVPGALVRARLEPEHFLSFGCATEAWPYFADGDVFFRPSQTGRNVVTLATEQVAMAGHLWPDQTERLLAGAAMVIDEPVGDGHILLFSDEPGYRGLWRGSVPLLLNALLYAPGLRNDVGTYVR